MSQYIGRATTSYFKVKDSTAFEILIDKYLVDENVIINRKEGAYQIIFLSGYPEILMYDENIREKTSENIDAILLPHLADGEVCVVKEAGFTGFDDVKSIEAYAWAFDNTGKSVVIALTDITEKIKETFGR